MFNWIKKKSKNTSSVIRDTLFGDMPISAWNGNNSSDEPWVSFQEVERYLELDNTQMATQILRKIIETPNLESRHYIQTWHFLKTYGWSNNQGCDRFNASINQNKQRNRLKGRRLSSV